MRYRNIIWDFDGTLFDSYPHSEAVFRRFLRETRGIEAEAEEVDRLFRQTLHAAFAHYHLTDGEIRAYLEREADVSAEPAAVPFPGAEAVLRGVLAAGGRNFLYTHRDRLAVTYLAREGLWPLFSGAVTAELGLPQKPDPAGVLHLLREYGLSPADSVMIGDRMLDVRSGQNAGIAGALVNAPAPPQPPDAPDYIAPDLETLARLLDLPFSRKR